MTWKDQLRFVRQNMKRNKTRLFMTVLATAMGCAFLIVLASVGFGLQKSIVDEIVGDRLVTGITVHDKDADKHNGEYGIRDEDMAYFRSLPHVKGVTYQNQIRQFLDPRMEGEQVNNIGGTIQLDYEEESAAGFELSAGRLPQAAHEVIVGYHIRQSLNDGENAESGDAAPEIPDAAEWIGKTMQLKVQYYVDGEKQEKIIDASIVGVAVKPVREWKKDGAVYIGRELLEEIEQLTGTAFGELPYMEGEPSTEDIMKQVAELQKMSGDRQYTNVEVIATDASKVSGLSQKLRDDGYYIYSVADEVKQMNVVFFIMKAGLVFIGTIAVIIASIGIFNTMSMAVTERAGDIGIMKAIGANPSAIKRIFLLESGLIGIMGAVIGTAVSYAISYAVNAGLPLLVSAALEEEVPAGFVFSLIPPFLVALSCAIAIGVAMLSGYRPANRACRIDVLRALRRDL
ncbi:FtsX-like permease family protein [Paenibacillus sp. J5C_2022]|uniref:ABC transporter permease n=1 Tax=Paenibacillus sp. J5C2022 TaxID=2977129 RepID=UPI0021CF2998|nr:FtsX-like permease family protein [Paenibacillus sp. J5C2022]MCU6712599.1 FtsX-like permease family protein [Paenibacillus sp. J5C2022]